MNFLNTKRKRLEALLSHIRRGYYHRSAVLKTLVSGFLLLAIGYQIGSYNNLSIIFNEFLSSVRERPAYYLCLAVGLMPFNLAFETLKWLQFVRVFMKMRFRQAFWAVLAGMSLGVVTPNRVGEFGGRLWMVAPGVRGQGAVSMLLGSYCQWIVLLFGGLVGFSWFAFNHLQWQLYLIWIGMIAGSMTCLLLLLLFWQIGRILPLFCKCGFKKRGYRWLRYVVMLRSVAPMTRLYALQWAALRYLTYSLQYWLLLQFFGVKVNMAEGFAGIASIFLIQTGVPLSAGLALLARGEIALFVWGHFGANELSVLAATFSLFVINLILPALSGAVFLIKRQDLKSFDYEKDHA